jgi:hypothetical protein
MPNKWKLVVKDNIAPGRACLPQSWFEQAGPKNTGYVRVGKGKRAVTLLGHPPGSALDGEIHVRVGTFGLGVGGRKEDVQAVPLSVSGLGRQRAKQAITTGIGLVGLVLAVAGFGMEGLLNFNQHYMLYSGSNLVNGLMSAFSPLMQIAGAILIFIQATVFGTTTPGM